MQRKLKSVFRSPSKRKSQLLSQQDQPAQKNSTPSPHHNGQSASRDERHGLSSDSLKDASYYQARSRPLSSIYNDPVSDNASIPQTAPIDYAQSRPPSDLTKESILDEYKAYLPALSPVDDSQGDNYMTLGGDRRLITGESDGRHEEDVADRNIARFSGSSDAVKRKPLPDPADAISNGDIAPRKVSLGAQSNHSTTSSVPSDTKYTLGRANPTKGGLMDSILPHTEVTAHEKDSWKQGNWPARAARNESQLGWSRRRPRRSSSDDDDGSPPPPPPESLKSRGPKNAGKIITEKTVAIGGPDEIEKVTEQLLDGFVDLRNTVDIDEDVRFAPAVTHEVVKPHEHEIIKHEIYREIHNYEYHHRIQPIYDLQVLPPRHWIPDPNGGGLIEISAEDLPASIKGTQRWEIVQKQEPQSSRPVTKFRTEPEIIRHPTTITQQGFERKETTIIYPPTIADMSDYDGLVQPVHFDHKTGKRWLGQVITMDKLQAQVEEFQRNEGLNMKELGQTLPAVPGISDVPGLSPSSSVTKKVVNEENTIGDL